MTRSATQPGVSCTSDRTSLRLVVALLLLVLLAHSRAVLAQTTSAKPEEAPAAVATPVGVPPVPTTANAAPPSAAPTDAAPTKIALPTLPQMPPMQGTAIDRVVAIVNNELILDSDVDQERRFSALLPYGEVNGPYNRDEAIERLINRALILQQSKLQPGEEVSTEAAEKDLNGLRKSIPTCKQYQCETQAGWDRFLASEGFTEQSLTNLWRQRMEVLAFIELRFRMGIKISNAEVQAYYEKTMLPAYAAQHVAAPPLESISKRIQEVLLQKQVSALLGDWLNSLRAQGNVVVLHPGEEAP